jgi:protein phosphatase
MVADGVGGSARGEMASRVAVQAVTRYVTRAMRCYYGSMPEDDEDLSSALEESARQCHAEVVRRGEQDFEVRGMATTLTLYLGVWPRGYLLQVGDSRCYLLRNGELTQITRDQTMAQELIDLGVMKPSRPPAPARPCTHQRDRRPRGPSQGHPVRHELGHVLLLYGDGLTRHVPDSRIGDAALDDVVPADCETSAGCARRWGSDNITVVVGQAVGRTKGVGR